MTMVFAILAATCLVLVVVAFTRRHQPERAVARHDGSGGDAGFFMFDGGSPDCSGADGGGGCDGGGGDGGGGGD